MVVFTSQGTRGSGGRSGGGAAKNAKDTEGHPVKVQISAVYCLVTDLLLLLSLVYGSHKVSLGLLDYVLTLEFQI